MTKLFLIVLYNCEVHDSKTCISLKKCSVNKSNDNYIFIWDNSNYAINSLEECKKFFDFSNVNFKHTPENISLAKIYNSVLEQNPSIEAFIIFDQDSEITQIDYIEYIESTVKSNPNINIFLPQIILDKKLYSPGRFWCFKGWHYKQLEVGVHKDSLYTAIMSGTVIRKEALDKYEVRFNEELRLYGIDTCFFTDLRKKDNKYYLLKIKLEHDLSETKLSRNDYKKRTNEYLDGCIKTARNNKFHIILIKIYRMFLKLLGKA